MTFHCPNCNAELAVTRVNGVQPIFTPSTTVTFPTPAQNAWTCPLHGGSRWVPPGMSARTGRAYNGFYACATPGCDQKPPRNAPQAAPATVQGPQGYGVAPESTGELP